MTTIPFGINANPFINAQLNSQLNSQFSNPLTGQFIGPFANPFGAPFVNGVQGLPFNGLGYGQFPVNGLGVNAGLPVARPLWNQVPGQFGFPFGHQFNSQPQAQTINPVQSQFPITGLPFGWNNVNWNGLGFNSGFNSGVNLGFNGFGFNPTAGIVPFNNGFIPGIVNPAQQVATDTVDSGVVASLINDVNTGVNNSINPGINPALFGGLPFGYALPFGGIPFGFGGVPFIGVNGQAVAGVNTQNAATQAA